MRNAKCVRLLSPFYGLWPLWSCVCVCAALLFDPNTHNYCWQHSQFRDWMLVTLWLDYYIYNEIINSTACKKDNYLLSELFSSASLNVLLTISCLSPSLSLPLSMRTSHYFPHIHETWVARRWCRVVFEFVGTFYDLRIHCICLCYTNRIRRRAARA